MHRLKTRVQFQAAMAGGVISRTAHFALHRLALCPVESDSSCTSQGPQAVVGSCNGLDVPDTTAALWLGAMVPKRWARRAVTRNAIKRQIYTLGATSLSGATFVVRLRAAFERKKYPSAWSPALRQVVRAELQLLFARAANPIQTPPSARGKKAAQEPA